MIKRTAEMYEWQKLEHIFLINLQNIENENNNTHVYLLENDRNRDLRINRKQKCEEQQLTPSVSNSLHYICVPSFTHCL